MNFYLLSSQRVGSFFSTETAVLKVVPDVLTAMDRGQITLLGMFDHSAAFDTVDHAILPRRLEVSFGIRGVALNWSASYLSGRSHQVSVHGMLALSTFLEYGVPQGSVLGPVLFFMCDGVTASLPKMSTEHRNFIPTRMSPVKKGPCLLLRPRAEC